MEMLILPYANDDFGSVDLIPIRVRRPKHIPRVGECVKFHVKKGVSEARRVFDVLYCYNQCRIHVYTTALEGEDAAGDDSKAD